MKLSRLREVLDTQAFSICVQRGPGIGDVLMVTPTIRAIKETFPEARISFATDTKYLDGAIPRVLQHNPHIFDIKTTELAKEEDFDFVIDLHCPCVSYENNTDNPPVNRIDLFANHAGIILGDKRPVYVMTTEEQGIAARQLDHVQNQPKVFIQPSASCDRRSYPHSKLKRIVAELAKRDLACFVSTHSSDWHTDVLWDNIPGANELKDWNVRQLAAFMSECDLVLCQDSAILHLAGALDVPTVGLFGPTHPDARVNYYPQAIALWGGEGLNPCPCWYNPCYIQTACWNNIYEDTVIETCMKHLEETRR